jgi:hypothetical protein
LLLVISSKVEYADDNIKASIIVTRVVKINV